MTKSVDFSKIRTAVFSAVLIVSFLQSHLYAQTKDVVTEQIAMKEFLVAAEMNDVDALQQGLDRGFAVDSRDSRGRTALLIATYHNAIAAAKFLIDMGANVNTKDELQDSPFLYAGAEGRLEILKLAVIAGADLDSVNRYGGTALIPAAHHGHVDVVHYLLGTGIKIDHVNYLGWTALLEAVILGDGGPVYQKIVKLLLDAGADPMIADGEGRIALDHAKARSQSNIVILLNTAKSIRQ